MSRQDIRLARYTADADLPEDLDGLRKTLRAALLRIEALEDEVARMRGEKPPIDPEMAEE